MPLRQPPLCPPEVSQEMPITVAGAKTSLPERMGSEKRKRPGPLKGAKRFGLRGIQESRRSHGQGKEAGKEGGGQRRRRWGTSWAPGTPWPSPRPHQGPWGQEAGFSPHHPERVREADVSGGHMTLTETRRPPPPHASGCGHRVTDTRSWACPGARPSGHLTSEAPQGGSRAVWLSWALGPDAAGSRADVSVPRFSHL